MDMSFAPAYAAPQMMPPGSQADPGARTEGMCGYPGGVGADFGIHRMEGSESNMHIRETPREHGGDMNNPLRPVAPPQMHTDSRQVHADRACGIPGHPVGVGMELAAHPMQTHTRNMPMCVSPRGIHMGTSMTRTHADPLSMRCPLIAR